MRQAGVRLSLMQCEPLESRRLLAAWGAEPQSIEQDQAVLNFPTITGQGVTIAQIDTGIDYTHPGLGGGFGTGFKVKGGWDFEDNDADPKDTFGHGTNVAGIMAASPFDLNGVHYSGLAPNASLVALRVSNGSDAVSAQRLLQALQWIDDNREAMGISIVNFSFGSGTYAQAFSDPTTAPEFKKLKDAGILFVSPSGNGGTGGGEGINWPAADPSVVAVGSVTANGSIATFTQRGATLDLLAPGEEIGTTVIGGTYSLVGLSSFSSPIIAGAAALLKQADPTLKPDDILSIFRASGLRYDDSSFGTRQAYSRVDVFNAITLALRRAPNAATDVGANGLASDLAYDKFGVLHFAYYDTTRHTIKYATRSAEGLWSATQIIDKSGNDVGASLSIALDELGRPSIAYYDASLGDLEYAHLDGVTWKKSTLDSKNIAGQFPSLAFDSNDNPVIAYYRKTSGDLRVMRSDGTTWTRTEVDTAGDVGQFASLAIKGSAIGVAYGDTTTGDLKYAQLNGGSWDINTVDDGNIVAFISLAFDSQTHPAISYYDATPANLKFAKNDGTDAWDAETIVSKGAVGLFTNLWFDDADKANILYFSRKANALFRLNGSFGNWSADTVRLTGGSQAVAAVNADGSAASYAYFDTIKLKLLTGDLL